jgi:hypothetical protein
MNVDEAMETAAEFKTDPMLFAETVAVVLAAEVERLRAELAAAVAELDELVNETIKRNGWGAE